MTRIKNRACALLLALALLLSLVPEALAAEVQAEATTVQMTKTEGTVGISNSSGRSISLIEKMRLYNGYHVETEEKSYAWINLDSTKLSKLDAVSEMELRKSGKKLELLLNEGNLFFNVTEPLEDDESLNIRTSTIVVGIRGTCGWVKIIDQWRVEVYVLEGTVTITVTDPVTGQTKEEPVSGGEKATCVVYPQDKNGDKCDIIIDTFGREDIDGFVLVDVVPDEPLVEKIYEETGIDLRDWPENPEERLKEDQEKVAEKLREIEKQLEEQDEHISVDPVWPDPAPTPTPELEPEDSGEEEPSPTPAPVPSVTGIAITPSTLNLYLTSADGVDRSSGTLRAVETLSDGSTRPASGVAWSAATRARSAGSPVTVVPNSDGSATITATGVGFATITAKVGGYSDTCTVTVGAAYPGGVTPTPGVYTITFDPNGGTVAFTNTTTESDGTLSAFPPVTHNRYTFDGWFTEPVGGTKITLDTIFTRNVTVYAHWLTSEQVIIPGLTYYTVTFNSTEGDWGANGAGGPISSHSPGPVAAGTTVQTALADVGNPTRAGYTLVNWNTREDGTGDIYGPGTPITSNLTLYAQWAAEGTTTHTVTLNANGGYFGTTNTTVQYLNVADGGTVILPTPTYPGHTLTGWNTAADGSGTPYSTPLTVTGAVTLYAQWETATAGGVTWNYDTGTQTLTISGAGPMESVEGHTGTTTWPWNDATYRGNTASIVIENGVTTIGSGAFRYFSALTSVSIPNGVTSIGDSAFDSCTSLTDIVIPDSVISIGHNAFNQCIALTSIQIPENVTSIGIRAFAYCNALTSVTIPNSITSISEEAFRSCPQLNGVVIPDSVTSIGNYAFDSCTALTSIEIPEKVTSIGDHAFEHCSALANVTISEGVASIGDNAFFNCNSLTDVVIPGSVTSIGNQAFYACQKLASVTISEGVTSIGDSAFNQCIVLTSVEIPDSVTSIGNKAFSGCRELASIEIPENVTSIGDNVFSGCNSLRRIVIPSKAASIGEYAFSGCTGLTDVEMLGSVTNIGQYAFNSCTGLTSIEIPESITSIGNAAFSGCIGLTNVVIPGSDTSIGNGAFSGCSNLASVTILEGVTSIGDSVFANCTGLTSVVIPGTVISIGNTVFANCTKLTSITYGGEQAKWNTIEFGTNAIPSGVTVTFSDGSTTTARTATASPYSDVPLTASYAPAVLYCREHELMNGTDATHFTPDGTLTRAMMVTVLHRLAGTPAAGTTSAFPDVASGQWYTQAVSWANSKGIVLGYPDGTFGVSDPVTHEQIALIFQRYSGGEAVEVVGAENPSAPATRAEIAATLMNYAKSGALSAVSAIDVMCAPSGIVPMEDGTVLVTDTYHKQLWKVNLGAGTVYAGGDTVTGLYGEPLGGYNDASLLESYFKEPWAVAPFLDGWAVSDTANNVVRLVRTKDTQTLNGKTSEGLTVTKLGVAFDRPTGLATDGKGNLYVSDTGKGAVRKITPEGKVTTVAKGLDQPMGLCWKNGVLYIAETGADRVVKLQNGQVTVVASGFNGPQGVAVGDDGAVYVADTSSGAVRMVCNGEVTTLVERDTAQVRSGLTAPRGLLVQDGRLYICDGFARKIFVLRLG